MAWLNEPGDRQEQLAERFSQRIGRPPVVQIPGAHDGLSGLMAKRAGFELLYLSGAAYTASRGLPDLGMVSAEEVAERARDIVNATNLPLLVDVDTGFGGVLNVARMARQMVDAKVAAVQIEDQELPKKCGHLSGKRCVSPAEMMQKIAMIKQIAPTLRVVARTDARAVEGMDAAVARARQYVSAGADAVFPEALTDAAEFRRFAEEIAVPLLANMTEFGKTPYYTAEQFAAFGFQMVIYPVSALRMAAKAYERLFARLSAEGSQQSLLDEMQTRAELYDTLGYYDYEALDTQIAKSALPEIGRE